MKVGGLTEVQGDNGRKVLVGLVIDEVCAPCWPRETRQTGVSERWAETVAGAVEILSKNSWGWWGLVWVKAAGEAKEGEAG